MELTDLASIVPNFTGLAQVERVKIFGWHLHVHKGKDLFTTADVRLCYDALHLEAPNIADILAKLAERKPKVVLRSRNQYKLEMRVRQELDLKFGRRPISVAVEKSLAELPARLADETKRKYLVEALNCYKVQCYRAAILMTWNLAYDHLLNWVLAASDRVTKFNGKLPNKPPFSTGQVVSKREDFEWLSEREVLEICGHKDVAIISGNLKKILIQNLDRRNMSAHPSTIEIKQVNAEDTISSLIENIVFHLT
jgi:hypothetical protein